MESASGESHGQWQAATLANYLADGLTIVAMLLARDAGEEGHRLVLWHGLHPEASSALESMQRASGGDQYPTGWRLRKQRKYLVDRRRVIEDK